MHARTLAVAAVAAASALGVAAAEQVRRPKIYFPRHIKRQFTNSTTITSPAAAPDETPVSEAPTTTKRDDSGGLLDQLLGPLLGSEPTEDEPSVTTVVIVSTIVVPPPDPTEAADASTGGLPEVIVPATTAPEAAEPTPDSVTAQAEDPTTSGILLAPTGEVTSKSGGLLDGLQDVINTIIDPITSILAPPNNTQAPPPAPATTSDNGPTEPTIVIPLPILSTTLTLPPVIPTTIVEPPPAVNDTSTEEPPPPVTTVVPEVTEGPELPVETVTEAPPLPTTSVDPLPPPTNETVTEEPPPPVTTEVPPPVITVTNSTDPPPVTVAPADPTDAPVGTATSIGVISTQTGTEMWLPTTIVQEASLTALPPAGLVPTSAASLPSTLPKAILPDSSTSESVTPPEDATLISIGFLFSLNYAFVSKNPSAASQIFALLPRAISNAGGFDISKVVMHSIVPLNTEQTLGYVTTLARAFVPSNKVDTLRMDVRLPMSPFYQYPDPLVANLTAQVNSAIDLLTGTLDGQPGITPEGGVPTPSGSGTGPGGGSTDPFGNPPPEQGSQSPRQMGMTAGIATAAVAVAGAYGAAMFIVARRYKRRRQRHARSSSIGTGGPSSGYRDSGHPTPEMRTRYTASGSPHIAAGALLSRDFSTTSPYGGVAGGRDSHGSGRSGMNTSARTAYISAPVAAANSLGWN